MSLLSFVRGGLHTVTTNAEGLTRIVRPSALRKGLSMYVDLGIVFLCAMALFLWALVMWTIGFKQGREEGYTAGYMKGRLVGRTQVGAQ